MEERPDGVFLDLKDLDHFHEERRIVIRKDTRNNSSDIELMDSEATHKILNDLHGVLGLQARDFRIETWQGSTMGNQDYLVCWFS